MRASPPIGFSPDDFPKLVGAFPVRYRLHGATALEAERAVSIALDTAAWKVLRLGGITQADAGRTTEGARFCICIGSAGNAFVQYRWICFRNEDDAMVAAIALGPGVVTAQ